jgi:Fe-S oxidoreductase
MTWQTPVFLIVAAIAFGYSGWKFATLFKLLKAHKGSKPRFDRVPERVIAVLKNVLGQRAVLRDWKIGLAHAFIFWGFIVITVGTVEQFVSTLNHNWSFQFLGETLYGALVFMQDLFTTLVLVGCGYAAYRRFIIRPKQLGQSSDANLVLAFTSSLMVSIFLMNAFHILGESPWYADKLFISSRLAAIFTGLELSPDAASNASTFFKWLHMLLVMGFSMYIPNSKHLHIVAAGPNTYFKNLDVEKPIQTIRFEDESVTQYGAAKVTDLAWKDTLDLYSCTECGRCEALCPAWNTGKPLSPKKLILDIKKNLYANKEQILSGNLEGVGPLVDENVTEDVLWACTTCRACEVACPVFIEQTDKIYEARKNLVMMESKFPAEVQTVFKNMETNGTPWAFPASDRANWAQGLEVPTMADVGSAEKLDVLLWVGCAGSYDDRNKRVLTSFVNVLKKADVKFAILGTEEQCTGDSARRIGNEYLFQSLATVNIETLNRYSVKRIVTACPHCFNTLKNEYKDFGGSYEVFHHSEFMATLIQEGKIKPQANFGEKVTFHDSCYIGRWNGIYDAPRQTLTAIPGAELIEVANNKEKGMCCGAGGGRMWMEETIGERVNYKRTDQLIATGATTIAASCPFCMTMMTDGVKNKEMTDTIKVMDIAELIDQATSPKS